MPLGTGARLGPYELLGLLGIGGMGEVYRASDTRLDRTVAIKVLPPEFAGDPERRQRFAREARAIASLTHPHICTLYEFDTQDDVDFLVMEHLEGETLAHRLTRGPVPLAETLRLAIQIAEALAAAHRHGIVHRDLKPSNVMLTGTGSGAGRTGSAQVKLLDFGLAKLRPPGVAHGLASTATASAPLTGEGTVVGTLQYMAPEQLEGKEVDARTDLFALGAIVYEMVTGRKAFEGTSQASLIAAILTHDPAPLGERDPLTPPSLDRIVRKCLAKDPEDRWDSAHDLGDEFRWILEDTGPRQGVPAPPRAVPQWRRTLPLILTVVVVLLVALASWNLLRPAPRSLGWPTRFVVTLDPDQDFVRGAAAPVAISAGGHLAYAAGSGVESHLYYRARGEFDARALPGTEGAEGPFFSPDGQWIGFNANGGLFKIPSGGGRVEKISDTSFTFLGAAWGADDHIVFATPAAGLWRVPAAGGEAEPLTHPDSARGELSHGLPTILPDGAGVLFTIVTQDGNRLAVLPPGSSEWRYLDTAGDAGRGAYARSGHLVYGDAGRLVAVSFGLDTLDIRGAPVTVLEGVSNNPWSGFLGDAFSLSEDGTLAYVPALAKTVGNSVVWVDRGGRSTAIFDEPGEYRYPRLSVDGHRLAVSRVWNHTNDIWSYDLELGTWTKLTAQGANFMPIWAPNGQRMVFCSTRAGGPNVYWKSADGIFEAEALLPAGPIRCARDWSPDGETVLVDQTDDIGRRTNIWRLSMAGDATYEPLVATVFSEDSPRFSPDGAWLAYVSDEAGRPEVYVQSFAGVPVKRILSTGGGTEPVWSRDGRELFYRQGNRMMVVEVSTEAGLAIGKPRTLFEGRFDVNSIRIQNYDVTPDGQRFVMIRRAPEASSERLNVVLNWLEELKQKVPSVRN